MKLAAGDDWPTCNKSQASFVCVSILAKLEVVLLLKLVTLMAVSLLLFGAPKLCVCVCVCEYFHFRTLEA